MFVVTVIFVVGPEFLAEFREALIDQARNSLALEPDCDVFDVCVDVDDPCSFFLYERYSDAAAFEAHLATAHFKAFDERVAPWVKSKSVRTWNTAGITK